MALFTRYEGKLRLVGFCSGIGMLETAIEVALRVRGVPASSVCHCEWEASTASVLRGIEAKAGSPTPIHGDMRTFDGNILRGKVDGICAGLPYPSFSVAGKNGGNSDERAWGENFDPTDPSTWGTQPHYLRLVSEICPGFCVIEEVPQYFTKGHFAPVGKVLQDLGYTYQDALIGTAGSVGASHKRERVFILAVHRDYDFRARLGELGIELANGLSNRECRGVCHGFDTQGGETCERGDGEGSPDQSCDGDDELAQNTQSLGRRGGCDGNQIGDNGKIQAEGLCGARANSCGKGCEGDEWAGSLRQPGSATHGPAAKCREELGDSECERLQGVCNSTGDTPTEGTFDRCRELGNAAGDEQRGLPLSGINGKWEQNRGSGSGLPLHAPGIDGYMAWCATAVMDPTRMPSVEPRFSMVVDGATLAGTDLLRIGGNCVDALEATACIGCLFDRWLKSSGI